MMNHSKQFKSMIFVLMTLLSVGVFIGCGDTSSSATAAQAQSNFEDAAYLSKSDKRVGVKESVKHKTKAKKAGWYIRMTAQSDALKDANTVFGYLKGAGDAKDRFDAEALSKSGGTYLYTTIYHTDFGKTKNYRSDYRAFKKLGKHSETWTIMVNSGDANADVVLSWDGVTTLKRDAKGNYLEKHIKGKKYLKKMRLVDVRSGEVIEVLKGRKSNTYTFNMEGQKTREFKWLLLRNGEEEPGFEPKMVSNRAPAMKRVANSPQQSDIMDDFTPPAFEKR
jgi:hypothetical protein